MVWNNFLAFRHGSSFQRKWFQVPSADSQIDPTWPGNFSHGKTNHSKQREYYCGWHSRPSTRFLDFCVYFMMLIQLLNEPKQRVYVKQIATNANAFSTNHHHHFVKPWPTRYEDNRLGWIFLEHWMGQPQLQFIPDIDALPSGLHLPRRSWIRLTHLRSSLPNWSVATNAACEWGAENQTPDNITTDFLLFSLLTAQMDWSGWTKIQPAGCEKPARTLDGKLKRLNDHHTKILSSRIP